MRADGAERASGFRMGHVPRDVHTIAAGLGWVLSLYASSPAPLWTLWRPLWITVAVSVLVLLVAVLAIGRPHLASLIATTALLSLLTVWLIALPLMVFLAWWMAVNLARRARGRKTVHGSRLDAISRALNVPAVIVVVLATNSAIQATAASSYPSLPPRAAASTADQPDIYLVLLDGYPRGDTLATTFGFDNTLFEHLLAERGFTISDQSRSNYTKTWVTLASLFQMKYVDSVAGLEPALSDEAAQYRALTRTINTGEALSVLHAHGYRIYSSPSAFSDAALTAADTVLDDDGMNWFDELVLRRSAMASALQAFAPSFIAGQQRRQIESAFHHLSLVAHRSDADPAFAFIHVLSPHPPFLYAADGSAEALPACYPSICTLWEPQQDRLGLTPEEFAAGLRGQMNNLNGRLLSAVDDLIKLRPDAVIVLFSDHGSRHSLDDPEEFYRSFLAARVPGHAPPYAPDISDVNLLSALFNDLFGTNLPQLDYHAWRSYFGPLDLQREH